MTKWFALVGFITGMLIVKNWKSIRKQNKEDLVIGIFAGIITIVVFTLMFITIKWFADKFPVIVFGGFGIYLVFRFIQVRILPKRNKKDLR